MYKINFPIQLTNRTCYWVDSGYLHFRYKWRNNTYPVELINDTLFIYKPLYEKSYIKEGYVRTSFNDSIVNILKRHEANYPELAGTWFLIRERGFNDGGEDYLLEFPHNIPDSIEISRAEFINGLKQNKVYLMSTDGKKREYFFSYHWGYLYLTPGKWYKGEYHQIYFRKK